MGHHLVLGYGEVGSSLADVLRGHSEVVVHDPEQGFDATDTAGYDCMHVCIPYLDDGFLKNVELAQLQFFPKLTIVHSTVKVGTTDAIHDLNDLPIAYSFVRGRHPNLAYDMLQYEKHVGAPVVGDALKAGQILGEAGFKVTLHDTADVVELGKLADTAYYGVCIAWTKELARMASDMKLDLPSLQAMNRTYNQGAARLGHPEWIRPELEATPGPIGGHCVVPNAALLQQDFPDSLLLRSILEAK